MVFGGHPDDPESGAGGLIATLTGLGHEVILAYGTAFRGDRQFFGRPEAEVRRGRRPPPAKSWVQPRSSSRMLMKSWWPTRRPLQAVSAWLDEVKPDIVVTHWPLDTHPNHHAVSSLVWQCYQRKGGSNLYFFEVMTDQQPSLQARALPRHQIGAGYQAASLGEHKSQEPAGIWTFHDRMHRRRGAECGTEFAEASPLSRPSQVARYCLSCFVRRSKVVKTKRPATTR